MYSTVQVAKKKKKPTYRSSESIEGQKDCYFLCDRRFVEVCRRFLEALRFFTRYASAFLTTYSSLARESSKGGL